VSRPGSVARLPLSALLSHALVAFTIELDNAWESQMPHRTTRYGGQRRAPYAVSLRQWSNFMRVLGEPGLTVAALERRTRATPQLDGMRRWGYVTIGPGPRDQRERPPERELLVVPTEAGRQAQEFWRGLPDAIEARWRARFGAEEVGELRVTLTVLRDQLGLDLPQFLTQFYGGYVCQPGAGPAEAAEEPLPLSALLSQVLQAFALEYEQDARASLCYSANVLRLLDGEPAKIAPLARRSGVAIEAIRTAAGILVKRGFIIAVDEPGVRAKHVRLTERGLDARGLYWERTDHIEGLWTERFRPDIVHRLRSLLEAWATESGAQRAPLWRGLDPPPGAWRRHVRPPEVLPHFPMPRQSGHPDGA
jgi:DNA-binding MarR family transcriptional regulator